MSGDNGINTYNPQRNNNTTKPNLSQFARDVLNDKLVMSEYVSEQTSVSMHAPLVSQIRDEKQSCVTQSPWVYTFVPGQEENPYINLTLFQSADDLNVSTSEVKIWFQNRRTKWKKQENISSAEVAEHKLNVEKNIIKAKNRKNSESRPELPLDHQVDFESRGVFGHFNSLASRDVINLTDRMEVKSDIHTQLRLLPYSSKAIGARSMDLNSADSHKGDNFKVSSFIKAEASELASTTDFVNSELGSNIHHKHTETSKQADSSKQMAESSRTHVNSKIKDTHPSSMEGIFGVSLSCEDNCQGSPQSSVSEVEPEASHSQQSVRLEHRVPTLIDSATSPSPPPFRDFSDSLESCQSRNDGIHHNLVTIPVNFVHSEQVESQISAESLLAVDESAIEKDDSHIIIGMSS